MGGRGSSFGPSIVQLFTAGGPPPPAVQRIHVIAEMNPRDRVYVNAEKTLQELETKKQAMDKEQLQILDQYGYVTTAYQGNEDSVGVDTYGLRQMRGNVVTHNHPGVFGGTFSDADIGTLQAGMKELRASGVEGTYSMRATTKADPHSFHKALFQAAPTLEKQMKDIAQANAKKQFSSYDFYVKENRRTQLEILHNWYSDNAKTHGYTYTFTPAPE